MLFISRPLSGSSIAKFVTSSYLETSVSGLDITLPTSLSRRRRSGTYSQVSNRVSHRPPPPPQQLILQKIPTQDIFIPNPPPIKFQKKFQPGHLKICSSKQTSSILLLKFFINRFSTNFQHKFCNIFTNY